MAEKTHSRRRFLKYAGAGVVAVIALGFCEYLKEQTPSPPPSSTSPTTSYTPTSSVNPVVQLALDRGIDPIISKKLGVLDQLDTNNKALVNFLYNISQSGVVFPTVLDLVPTNYQTDVIKSLQAKTIDDVVKEHKVSDQAACALSFLSTFPGNTQRNMIQFNLDETTLEFLSLASTTQNQEFAKYAVTNRVPIQDHKLTDLKKRFLQDPERCHEDLFNDYIAELESAGNLYKDLASEWKHLPESGKIDLALVDSTGDMVDLFLNATNPEVKEAGEIILGGGTPDPLAFGYVIPNYNTELQVLGWLGRQNLFRRDDTLALAIASVNGWYVTIGDEQVRAAVYNDSNDILGFLREVNEVQGARGYQQLENFPLEAKICLSWTGSQTPVFSQDGHASFLFTKKKLDLESYQWDNVSINTLREMRSFVGRMRWIDASIDKTITNLEENFYKTLNWSNPPNSKLSINGKEINAWFFGDVDYQFQQYIQTGHLFGVCTDEEGVMEALCKSWGIPTDALQLMKTGPTHTAALCYDHKDGMRWKLAQIQKNVFTSTGSGSWFVFKPPINQRKYVTDNGKLLEYLGKGWVYLPDSAYSSVRDANPLDDVPTKKMKSEILDNNS
jgi:hypothetical protein